MEPQCTTVEEYSYSIANEERNNAVAFFTKSIQNKFACSVLISHEHNATQFSAKLNYV